MASLIGVAPSRPSAAIGVHRDHGDGGAGEREPEVAPRGRRRRTPTIASTIANAAPALMPRMPGSASGLRVSPCMQAPASPSAPPTASASRVRGSRAAAIAWSGSAASKTRRRRDDRSRTRPGPTASDRRPTATAECHGGRVAGPGARPRRAGRAGRVSSQGHQAAVDRRGDVRARTAPSPRGSTAATGADRPSASVLFVDASTWPLLMPGIWPSSGSFWNVGQVLVGLGVGDEHVGLQSSRACSAETVP